MQDDKMADSKDVSSVPITEVSSQEEKVGTVSPIDETANRRGDDYMGQYRRSFRSRHIQIVTLGSNIGSGLFISTGKALRNAGPGNMIIGYTTVMTMVCAPMSIGRREGTVLTGFNAGRGDAPVVDRNDRGIPRERQSYRLRRPLRRSGPGFWHGIWGVAGMDDRPGC